LNKDKNIKNIAINVLLNEANAIKNLALLINSDFESCVNEILQSKGRVVVTGIGKSAIIATKIVATLNSTGTPAIFMHAADAIHGDLGMIQKEDIVLVLSKSGNTSEIKVLIPLIKRTGTKIVAIVSNMQSYLAIHADYVLNATIESEACPHNLAPTTSTTAHLALGDALAVALIESRDFSSQDFAKYHPGGSLGKKLYLKVDDVYPNNELPMVGPEAKMKDVIVEITSKRLGVVAVVDVERRVLGVITDGDIRRMLQKYDNFGTLHAKDIMTVNPKAVKRGDYAVDAFQVMEQNNITQLIVIEDNKLLGFIHLHDLIKEGLI
jgi:arabinose-5-phosphate isomerase